MKLGSRLVIGAVAGIVDAAASPPEEAARDLTTAAHFAYGAACGALLAAADPKPGKRAGAAAGATIWLASYMGWIPALNLLEPATEHPARRNALMIAVHLVWGTATAEALRELAAARETIFAGGQDRDVPEDRPSGARN